MAIGIRRDWILPLILLAALLVRLHNLSVPLLDQMFVKQIYVANKARNVARAPIAPLRDTLDFLDPDGDRMRLAEEIPLYPGILGIAYAAFGEQEWLGRVLSLAGALVAVAAFHSLLKREYSGRVADAGALLLGFAPLLIFYGRAVMADSWMLAGMLVTAAAYRRFLDERSARWLILAALSLLVGAAFKYYALMVVFPLAEMTRRRDARGWRACLAPRFLALCAVGIVPVACWVALVFARTPNPTAKAAYYAFQEPSVLWTQRLYQAILDRFFLRDCGPVAAALAVVGGWAVAKRRFERGPVLAWGLMGLGFMVLLGPKTLTHDYYELMAVPAVCLLGALGWEALRTADRFATVSPRRRSLATAGVVAAVVIIHSPWVGSMKFEQNPIHGIVAQRLDRLCSPNGRIVVLGQQIGWPVVHYSGRLGWVLQDRRLRDDWRTALEDRASRGAEFVALYFDPTVSPANRGSFQPLLDSLPIVEQGQGPWFAKGKPCEYYILSLRNLPQWARSCPEAGTVR